LAEIRSQFITRKIVHRLTLFIWQKFVHSLFGKKTFTDEKTCVIIVT